VSLSFLGARLGAAQVVIGLVLASASTSACSGGVTDLTCGEGTVQEGNECVGASGGGQNEDGTGGSNDGSGGTDGSGGDGSGGDGSGGDGAPSTGGAATGGAGTGGTSSGGGGSGGGGSGGSGSGGSGSGGSGSGGSELLTEAPDCGSRSVSGATVVSGVVTTDTTWSGLIHVSADVSIQNEAILTILPGTKIIVGHDVEILFGWEDSAPTLIARGTVDEPILFCGEAVGTGYWKHLRTNVNVSSESILENVLISGAGSEEADAVAALHMEGLVTVRGVHVVDSGTAGVVATDFGTSSETLNVSGAQGHVADIMGPGAMTWPANSELSEGYLGIIELYNVSFNRDITLRNIGALYRPKTFNPVVDNGEATIVFEAGVIYQDHAIDFGAARLLVQGTEENPVTFTCRDFQCESPQFSSHSAEPSEWSNVVVSISPGYDLLFAGAGPTLMRNVSGILDLYVAEGGLAAGSEDIHVETLNLATCAYLQGSLREIDAELTSFGTGVLESGASCILTRGQPSDTFETGGIRVSDGASLTIEAGVSLDFIEGSLAVEGGGSLSINGTAEDPIWVGGDFYGLRLESSDVTIKYATMEAHEPWGAEQNPACSATIVAEQPIVLENSEIRGIPPRTALCISTTDTTDYTATNTLLADGAPVAPVTFVP